MAARSGPPVAGSGRRAARKPRKSCGVRTKNIGMVRPTMSVLLPSVSRNLTAMPRPSRVWSAASGSPLPLEKRTTTGISAPCRWAARLCAEAAGFARNVPVTTVPRACAARKPAWVPLTALSASTNCSPKPSESPGSPLIGRTLRESQGSPTGADPGLRGIGACRAAWVQSNRPVTPVTHEICPVRSGSGPTT